MISFYSNGKLLLTGEYVVLYGAQALAVPLNLGQSMEINEANDGRNIITWEASDSNGIWFNTRVTINNFEIMESSDYDKSSYLANCLRIAKGLSPIFLSDGKSKIVKNHCTFDINWGLGSSSTFLSNLAFWADVDPFQLHQAVSNGSGYDIACARSASPIIYTLQNDSPSVINTVFNPPFINNLFLVYTGKKQVTSKSLGNFKSTYIHNDITIKKISKLTTAISETSKLDDFMQLLDEHEYTMAKVLSEQPVKTKLFHDFDGTVKSLGAWGGDFLLTASKESGNYITNYFSQKGFSTIIPFGNLILKS